MEQIIMTFVIMIWNNSAYIGLQWKNVEIREIRGTTYNKYAERTPLQYVFPFLFAWKNS